MQNLISFRFLRILAPALLSLMLGSCSGVGPLPCHHRHASNNTLTDQPTEQLLRDASKYYQKLKHSKSSDTLSKYNEICEALLLQDSCRDKNLQSLPPEIGKWYELKTNGYVTPSYFDAIFPAAQVYTEKFYESHYRKGGLGVPLVGWKKNTQGKPNPPEFMAPSGRAFNLTAVLSFEKGQPLWMLYQAKHTESVTIGQTSHALSGDFTAADAIFWDRSILKKNILEGLILPDRIFGDTGLYMDAPYDPTKIPVLCVHGLKSSPDVFMFMVNDLRQDLRIRQHYQFVYFYYPTGAPWMYTAATFRDKVRELENYANSMGGRDTYNQMVILSHSMGGLISRASTCVTPKPFYDAVYDKDITQLRGSERNRRLVRRLLYYETLKAPKRIVFMATPHKGSTLADWRVVNLFSRLIQLPTELSYSVVNAALDTGANFVEGNIDNFNLPTSLDQLSPNNRMILAVPKLEFPAYMKVHSIVGARKGNPKGDGVVEYWSSHLPSRQTESELIINSDHSVPFKKEAIQEVNRILHLHLKEAGKN